MTDVMADQNIFKDADGNTAIKEAKPELRKPSMYRVLLLNDDFTPMDFVVEVLVQFFNMSDEKATKVMLQVHTQGLGVCGTFTKDVAETKVHIVNNYSREHHHPLMCTLEEAV
jgi:ATP-dependent Clp protease adaptor protein ClpS